MNAGSEPRPIQHMIPRQYLRGFAHPPAPTRVWVYTKGRPYSTQLKGRITPNPALVAIKKAGAARGAYQMVTLTGEPFDADGSITKQENLGVQVLHKLRARAPISLLDKIHFSIYIELMRARVPAGRDHAMPHVMYAIKKSFDLDRLQRLAAQEGRFDVARRLDSRFPENLDLLARELHLKGVAEGSRAIPRQIFMMQWLFFTVEGDRFFPTTDNPAFFSPGRPLKSDDGFILMPIDLRTVLRVSNRVVADRQYVSATADDCALFRSVILSGAKEKAFAHTNDPAILDMLNNPQSPPR